MESSDQTHTLPISTFLSNLPSHPLVSLLTQPLIPRTVFLESTLLLSTPASLLHRCGLGDHGIIMLTVVGAGVLGAKYKDHWKSGLAGLGVIEAVVRSLNVLEGLDFEVNGGMAHEGNGKKSREERDRRQHEIKHLLCFWLLFASLSLVESIRTLPTSSNDSTPILVVLRDTVAKLRKGLWRNIPSLVPPTPAARARRPFPQPSSFPLPLPLSLPSIPSLLPTKSVRAPLPLSPVPSIVRSIPTRKSLKYALLKLLVLWIGLRKDGFGASAIWDWVLGPLFAVKRSRGGVGKIKKVIQVQVITKSTTSGTTSNHSKTSSQSRFEAPRPNQQDLFSSSSLTQGASQSDLTPTSASSISSSDSSTSSHQTVSPPSHSHHNPQTPTSNNTSSYKTYPFSPTSSTAFSSPASPHSLNSHSHARDHETHFPSPAGVAYRITSSTRPIFGRSESGGAGGEGKGYYLGEGEGKWEDNDDDEEGEETEGEADRSW